MKAKILKGKYKSKICEVSQWCNDWFTLDSDIKEITTKAFSPSSLAFDVNGMFEIKHHKNNGMLWVLFKMVYLKKVNSRYCFSFKRRLS